VYSSKIHRVLKKKRSVIWNVQHEKKLPIAQIDSNLILMEKFYNVINNNFILTGIKKCCQKNCPGYETTTLCKIGK